MSEHSQLNYKWIQEIVDKNKFVYYMEYNVDMEVQWLM